MSSFEDDLRRMHEKDNNKHALQWFIADIVESKDKYCVDKHKLTKIINDRISKLEINLRICQGELTNSIALKRSIQEIKELEKQLGL